MSIIDEADALARAGFSYQPDPVGQDRWRSHFDDVMAGLKWAGDCDDLGSTVLDLCARRYGVQVADLFAMEVSTKRNGVVDHYVGAAYFQGQFYIVGDTFFPGAYAAEDMAHQPVKYRRLSSAPDEWRDGAPFQG